MTEHDPAADGSDLEPRHDDGPVLGLSEGGPGRRRSRKKRRGPWGCLIALLVVTLLIGGVAWAGVQGLEWVRDQFSDTAEDFPGPGSGEVVVEVQPGDGTAQIGRTLKDAGVVASVTAFTDAAAQRSSEVALIQPGHYSMRKEMRASDAVAILVDPSNVDANQVVIPEGFRVDQTVTRLAEASGIAEAEFEKVLADPEGLGLPASAEGDPEGYLFPATYSFGPDAEPVDMLRKLVDQYNTVARQVPVSDAQSVGLDEHDFMTFASIIEKEVSRPEDVGAVAEVIYNRLDGTCREQGIPEGLLQMDSTIHFLTGGGTGGVFTSDEARESDSPYNTYRVPGLPPGPIASPGKAAMEAVLAPTTKGYCYFVAVDLDTGETRFAKTQDEHNANREVLNQWCRENSGRCG